MPEKIQIQEFSPLPDGKVIWTPEAEKRLKAIPLFLRGMVRKRLEASARTQGKVITPEFMANHKKKREKELGFRFKE